MKDVLKSAIKMHGHGAEAGKLTIPALWETVGTISGGTAGLAELGRSLTSPAVFFVFSDKEHRGPNRTFVATINFSELLNEAIAEVAKQHAEWRAAQPSSEES